MNKHTPALAAAAPRTSIAIASVISNLREEHRAALADIDRRGAARPALLRTGTDAEVEANDNEAARAGRTVERTAARIEVLAADLKAAEYAEDQVERRSRYEAAVKLNAEVEQIVRNEYGPAAATLCALMERIRQCRAVVDDANDRLPDGAARISDPEDFRGRQPRPGTSKQETVTSYVAPDGTIVPGRSIHPDPAAPGTFRGPMTGPANPSVVTMNGQYTSGIVARQETRTVYSGQVDFQPPVSSLLASVKLPGLLWHDKGVWPPEAP